MIKIPQLSQEYSSNYSRYLYALNNDLYNLQVYTFDAETQKSNEPNEGFRPNYHINSIQFKSGELICARSRGGENLWLINAKTLDISFRNIPKYCCSGPFSLYWDNNFYSFGGWFIDDNNNFAYKYDLMQDKWTKISNFSKNLCWCSCVYYKNLILIASFLHSEIFLYDIIADGYSIISFLEWSEDKCKVIFVGNSRAYLVIDGGGIFESGPEDEYRWNFLSLQWNIKIIGTYIPWISYNNYVYFETHNLFQKIFYLFDLSTKKIVQIELYKI